MNMFKKITLVGVTVALALTATACGSTLESRESEGIKVSASGDPREGLVEVKGSIDLHKICDGTTLLYIFDGYREGGVAVVPDSPECEPQ